MNIWYWRAPYSLVQYFQNGILNAVFTFSMLAFWTWFLQGALFGKWLYLDSSWGPFVGEWRKVMIWKIIHVWIWGLFGVAVNLFASSSTAVFETPQLEEDLLGEISCLWASRSCWFSLFPPWSCVDLALWNHGYSGLVSWPGSWFCIRHLASLFLLALSCLSTRTPRLFGRSFSYFCDWMRFLGDLPIHDPGSPNDFWDHGYIV